MQLVALVAAVTVILGSTASVPPQAICSCKGHILDCSKHNVTSLSQVTSCTDATTVSFEGNLLQVFPNGLTSFENVKAGGNKLLRLPTATQLSSELKNLELNDNQIANSSNEFRALSSLRRLRLDNNGLTSLEFLPEECNLYSLDVSGNAISSLSGPLVYCTGLIFLSLSENQITEFPKDVFKIMAKLKHLYLNGNKIVSLPGGTFAGLSDLRDLSLQMNRGILLFSNSFEGLSHLETLDLGFNHLQSLPPRVFASTPLLEKLNLVTNNLTTIPSNVIANLNSIKEIELWNNRMVELPVLENCCDHLRTLNLQGNSVAAPLEAAVRSVLRGRIRTTLGGRLVRPQALAWAARAGGVEAFVGALCSCGGLRRGLSEIEFCVDTVCGKNSSYKDWRDAMRGASSLSAN